jgi:hypothetical protein
MVPWEAFFGASFVFLWASWEDNGALFMTTWYILDREGAPQNAATLEERPVDAQPTDEGAPFTPWYKHEAHLHIEEGRIQGIHAKGSLDEVRALLRHFLKNEAELLEKMADANSDISLSEANRLVPFVPEMPIR